jgi:hypothetical protein
MICVGDTLKKNFGDKTFNLVTDKWWPLQNWNITIFCFNFFDLIGFLLFKVVSFVSFYQRKMNQ